MLRRHGCTYIPSSSARLEVLGAGVERPELAGETERPPSAASRLIASGLVNTYWEHRNNSRSKITSCRMPSWLHARKSRLVKSQSDKACGLGAIEAGGMAKAILNIVS